MTKDEERFWDKVEKTDDCWNWTGAIIWNGYGQIKWGDKVQYAHRVSYLMHIGEIEKGLTIDHLCRNRRCVNPIHLEAVTNKTNLLRGYGIAAQNARKTHCKLGHPLTGRNLLLITHGRACRECQNRLANESYHRLKTKV